MLVLPCKEEKFWWTVIHLVIITSALADQNKQQDIIAAHVDDFCFAGSEIFYTRVIESFCHVVAVKSEEVAEFRYIRQDIRKKGEHIKLWQNEYFKKFKYIPVETTRNLEDEISNNRDNWNQANYWLDLILVMMLVR